MGIDLNLLPLFIAVSEEKSFASAAIRLGVTRSAVSQGIRRLEDSCKIALVTRTTRSVRLTEAGQRLLEMISRPIVDVQVALEGVSGEANSHSVLRIAATSIAESFLSGPLIASFIAKHPRITLDITVTDEIFDIVAGGFDAGVRLGEVIEQDMVAVALTGEQQEAVVATREYFEQNGVPKHPRELINHRCIGWRPAPDLSPHRWEFAENGVAFDVDVGPQVTTNDLRLMIRSALAGGGITFALKDNFQPYIESGDLILALESYLPKFPGFFLYFPSRRNMESKLRVFIDHIRERQL
ncbi:MAG: LysR substrate-binding domain-containing protein [Pseudomonadota bacterium]